MARKSKSERLESRARWQAIREIRDAKVRFNMANPDSELLAPNVIPNRKTRMDLGRALSEMKDRHKSLRIVQLPIQKEGRKMSLHRALSSRALNVTTDKELQKKFGMNDQDLYKEKLDVTGGTVEQSLVRVGSRGKSKDTRAKGKTGIYRPVGKPDSIPKDGGKGLK